MALCIDEHSGAPTNGPPRGKIVVVNGFPGTGKLTILKHIEAQTAGHQQVCVVDSHLIIDPAQSAYPDCDLNHYYLRRQLRGVYFKEVRRIASQGFLVLMTACLGDNELDRKVLDEHLGIIRGTEIPMHWINVRCEQRILEERVASQERVRSSKAKLTDVKVLRRIISENRLILPSRRRNKLDGISLITADLDVGGSVEEAVGKVSAVMGRER
ncbi:hypothetical protein ACJ41O_004628 [Fusarium nematophilum]